MNTKKERIAYFQSLVDKKLTLDQIRADKEVSEWGLAESTIQRYALECDYVEPEPQAETKQPEPPAPEQPEKNTEETAKEHAERMLEAAAQMKKDSEEATNDELDSDTQKPLPNPPQTIKPMFDEKKESVIIDRILEYNNKSIELYTQLIDLRLKAKKSTTRLNGLRRKAFYHVKLIRDFNKGETRR